MEKEKSFLPQTENVSPENQKDAKAEINKIVESFSLDEVAMLEKAIGDLRKKMHEDQLSEERRWPEDMEMTIIQLYEKIWKIQSLTKQLRKEN